MLWEGNEVKCNGANICSKIGELTLDFASIATNGVLKFGIKVRNGGIGEKVIVAGEMD